MKKVVRKVALFAAGVYSFSREKVEQFVDDIREEGEISEEEGRQLVEDLWERAKETEKKVQDAVEEKVKAAMAKAPKFATKEALADLEERVNKLEG